MQSCPPHAVVRPLLLLPRCSPGQMALMSSLILRQKSQTPTIGMYLLSCFIVLTCFVCSGKDDDSTCSHFGGDECSAGSEGYLTDDSFIVSDSVDVLGGDRDVDAYSVGDDVDSDSNCSVPIRAATPEVPTG